MDSAMRSTGMVIRELQERWIAQTTDKQKALIDEFKQIAGEWHAERMPLRDAISLTGDGWLRNQITRRITQDDPAYTIWHEFLEAILLDANGMCQLGVQTPQGFVRRIDIEDAGGQIVQQYDQATGEIICTMLFPRVVDNNDARRSSRFLAEGGYTPATLADWEE